MSWYNSTTLILDDTSPRIVYTPPGGAWPQITVPPSVGAYNNTLTQGEEPGFSWHFNFTGVAIDVYGVLTRTPGTPSSSYSIDGGPATRFVAPDVNATQPNVLFFRSPRLPPGSHTLDVSIIVIDAVYNLDYVLYTPGDVAAPAAKRALEGEPAPLRLAERGEVYGGASTAVGLAAVCLMIIGAYMCLALRRKAGTTKTDGDVSGRLESKRTIKELA